MINMAANGAIIHEQAEQFGFDKTLNISNKTTIQSVVEQVYGFDANLEFTCSESDLKSFFTVDGDNYIGKMKRPVKQINRFQHSLAKKRGYGASLIILVFLNTNTNGQAIDMLRGFGDKHKLKIRHLENPSSDMNKYGFSDSESKHSFSVTDIQKLARFSDTIESKKTLDITEIETSF